MELEGKSVRIVNKTSGYNNLDEFNSSLQLALIDIHRDEYKLKLLDLVGKEVQKRLEEHKSDGSCERQYPNGDCPTDAKFNDAFMYIEQEYDRILTSMAH